VRRDRERERMNTRSGDAEGDIRGKMIAPVRDGNGGQKRKLVQSNDIQRDEDGGAKRRIIQSSDQKNGKILRGIHGCVSPRCSAPTYQSRFSWYFLLLYELHRSVLRYFWCASLG
jgi:hypothetical protein